MGATALPAVTSAEVGAAAVDAVGIAVVATCEEPACAVEPALVGSVLPIVVAEVPADARLPLESALAMPKPPSPRMETAAIASAAHFPLFPCTEATASGALAAVGALIRITVASSATTATGVDSTLRCTVVSSPTLLRVSGERSMVPSAGGVGAAPRANKDCWGRSRRARLNSARSGRPSGLGLSPAMISDENDGSVRVLMFGAGSVTFRTRRLPGDSSVDRAYGEWPSTS